MITSSVGASIRTIMIVCSLVCLSAGGAIGQSQETDEQLVDRLRKAIQKEEWRRARSEVVPAPLALKPQSAEANYVAAQVYWHEDSRWMAFEAVEKAIENQPVYPEAHLLLARFHSDRGSPDKARDEVNIAIAQGVSRFPAYRLLGEIAIAKGDFAAAISSLETAIQYSTIDDADTNRVREQLLALREFNAKLARFAELEERQKGSDIVHPVLVTSVGPPYTEEARKLKIQGTVNMVIVITEQGDVDTVLIYGSLGHGLDEGAMETARKLKFSPATQSGTPVRYLKKLSMEFILK